MSFPQKIVWNEFLRKTHEFKVKDDKMLQAVYTSCLQDIA